MSSRRCLLGLAVVLTMFVACSDDGDDDASGGTSSTGVTTVAEVVSSSTTDEVPETVETGSQPLPSPVPESSATVEDDVVVPEGFAAVTIRVTAADGSVDDHSVWLAENSRQQQRGLMEVTDLDGAAGMLFAYDGEVDHRFYMYNTPMPLSIAFFDGNGQFLSSTDMEPCLGSDSSDCPRYTATDSYQYALEVPQGDLPTLGVGAEANLEVVASSETDRS